MRAIRPALVLSLVSLCLGACASRSVVMEAPGEDRSAPWWNRAVFYEVFVRSFKDSSAGPLANDGVGDLQGLIESLDYLNDGDPRTASDLGVNALWLMPINPSPSYHGYDVTDYDSVNPAYGTNDDFRRLVRACHARGVRVIIDLVLNHTSDRHPFFAESRTVGSARRDWYVWSPTDPGWKGESGNAVWHRDPSGWYFGLFNHDMPDLNFADRSVTDEMSRVARFWLRDMGADGFRLDAARHLIEDGRVVSSTPATLAWLKDFQGRLKAVDPAALSVGEVWGPTEESARYVPAAMDLTFNFELARAVLDSVRDGRAAPAGAALEKALRLYPPGQFATFLTNHDQERVMSALGGDEGRARVAAALLFTLPGVPFVYYGEEIGMRGGKPDPDIRTPMQWTGGPNAGFCSASATPWRPANVDAAHRNVQGQHADETSLLGHYRRLIGLRRSSPSLARGVCAMVRASDPGVLAFVRVADASAMLVMVNVTGREIAGCTVSSAAGPLASLVMAPAAGTGGTGGQTPRAGPRPLAARERLRDARLAEVPAPDGSGAFPACVPLGVLAPRSAYIIELTPAK
ncbi:MAG: alpha-amylase [Phycisphaerae bacterium]|nr:alpha-amylase [Phycisphaerae bacterium]